MSETPTPDGAAPAGGEAVASLRVLAQYLKDLSFESPRAPESFRGNGAAPGIDVNVEVSARPLGNDAYEVELSVSARATRDSNVVFLVESTYAGVFEIKGVPQDQLEPIMVVECPRLLFPFMRQIVAETTGNGNFPPLMLDPIDFFAIYMQRRQQAASAAAMGEPASA